MTFFLSSFTGISFRFGSSSLTRTKGYVGGTTSPIHGTDAGETQPVRSTYHGTKPGAIPDPRRAVQNSRCRGQFAVIYKVIATRYALAWLLDYSRGKAATTRRISVAGEMKEVGQALRDLDKY